METGYGWRFRAIGRAAADIYSGLVALAAINTLWFAMSLTVVLLPPATAALYQIAAEVNRGRGPYVRDYLAAVRRLWLKSWLWGGLTLALGAVSAFAVLFYGAQQPPFNVIFLGISGTMIILMGAVQFYFWPYMVLQAKPQMAQAARNALFTILGDPLLLMNVGLALLLLIPSVILIAPLILITPVTIAFLGTYSLHDWLERHHFVQHSP
jgi:hypothetical protein